MFKSDKTYDTLKTISLLFVPVSGFIASVVTIFGVPYADKITALLTALDTCLGGIVLVAKKLYDKKKGEEESTENE